jgi:hypothetical protein
MQTPNITVSAEKAPEQEAPWPMAMLGVMGAELWLLSVTCPHGTKTLPTILRPCTEDAHQQQHPGDCPGPTIESVVEFGCEQVRRQWPQKAECACSEAYWARRGPVYELAKHLGPTQLMGHAPTDCYSAN